MIDRIRYFIAVVDYNSFSRAAEECYISQSAISQQIQTLEKELGVNLIERSNRSFHLTEAGEYFYRKGKTFLKSYEALCQETVNIASHEHARLRIGYLKSFVGEQIMEAISDFSTKEEGVDIEVFSGTHEDLYEALLFSRADIVINDQRRAFSSLYRNEILIDTGFYVEVSSRNPLSSRESADVAELENETVIIVSSEKQRKNEENYYREVIGISGKFRFVESVEEARLLAGNLQGVILTEGAESEMWRWSSLAKVRLMRNDEEIKRKYCCFSSKNNTNMYIPVFTEILKSKF